jgi:hypothetical protein
MALTTSDHYAKMVCLFLAEGLRSRRITLPRASEIAEKVLAHINLIDTESAFLSLIKELSHDFEEIRPLHGKVLEEQQSTDRRKVERLVEQYAVQLLPTDPKQAMAILDIASKQAISLNLLSVQFPDFKRFYDQHHD